MATGYIYCGRNSIRGGSDDWSFTVDELLRVTAAQPITKKSNVLRGNDNVVGFLADTSPSFGSGGGGGADYVEGDVPDWPDGPISNIHAIIRAIEDLSEEQTCQSLVISRDCISDHASVYASDCDEADHASRTKVESE